MLQIVMTSKRAAEEKCLPTKGSTEQQKHDQSSLPGT